MFGGLITEYDVDTLLELSEYRLLVLYVMVDVRVKEGVTSYCKVD